MDGFCHANLNQTHLDQRVSLTVLVMLILTLRSLMASDFWLDISNRGNHLDCYRCLSDVLMMSKDQNLDSLTCAIALVLTSVRPLHRLELQAALKVCRLEASGWLVGSFHPGRVQRCSPWESMFRCTELEFVHFSLRYMPTFLQSFRIRGIDTSHRTIAVACLAQMEMDSGVQANSKDCISSFSEYARQNWRHHYQAASRKSLFSPSTLPPNCSLDSNSEDRSGSPDIEDWSFIYKE